MARKAGTVNDPDGMTAESVSLADSGWHVILQGEPGAAWGAQQQDWCAAAWHISGALAEAAGAAASQTLSRPLSILCVL